MCCFCALHIYLTQHAFAGIEAGSNVKLALTTGHRPKLTGAEEALDELTKRFANLRATGAAFNTVAVRGIFIASLKKHGHAHLLSPHLLDPEAEPDSLRFMFISYWLQ